ncbi:hypothetical protein J2787_003827 [Chryseobacterium rhizosphaerae]|uniref:Uncharacterized protein n=1 Tax=Chryseobacterium rhizosphaerae TaxID=395937 RepID=A0AAE3YDF5_9FLAO|nr:hypothetical protein [Chryseobacterium rhizosphaerae]MDR6528390.1 hypothetical protein [Chryseobacterium rhizosphaerae]
MSQRTTFEDFLRRSKEVHGSKYDYSKVIYTTTENRVIITCNEHGDFEMRPRAHYSDKRGCPNCDKSEKSGFHKSKWYNKSKFLYLIEFFGNGERFLKFGVTITDIETRVLKGEIPYSYKILFSKKINIGEDAMILESELKNKYSKLSYKPILTFRGSTECLEFGIKDIVLKKMQNLTKQ